MEPLLLITRADAGVAESLGDALDVLRSRTSVEVCETANPGELDGVLHRAGSRPIVVAGGDGSLRAVVATLHRRNDLTGKTLGLLPLGAGNDFARAAGIPVDPIGAAEALLDASPRPMDLIVDELGEVVVNHVRAGAGAPVRLPASSWTEHLGPLRLGRAANPVGAALRLLRPASLRLRVEVDQRVVADVDRHVRAVTVTSGIGGDPGSVPATASERGELAVTVSFAVGGLARFGGAPDPVRLHGRQVSVSGEDFWISADGRTSGPERRRTWHLEPAAYSLLLPVS